MLGCPGLTSRGGLHPCIFSIALNLTIHYTYIPRYTYIKVFAGLVYNTTGKVQSAEKREEGHEGEGNKRGNKRNKDEGRGEYQRSIIKEGFLVCGTNANSSSCTASTAAWKCTCARVSVRTPPLRLHYLLNGH